jgi:uncharacterized protein YdeI (YjbR/CyaY-like superfamily)
MVTKDPRFDAYIAKAAPFAQPILKHLRALVHEACPEVEEGTKWHMLFFSHRGPLCMMAAFKQHCAFGFWKGKLLFGAGAKGGAAHGQFGRLAAVSDLPPRAELKALLKQAIALNEQGVKVERGPKSTKPPAAPADLKAALKKNARAAKAWAAFSPSCQREYVDWIVEAKKDETRSRRLETAVAWIAEGKQRNWKYQK